MIVAEKTLGDNFDIIIVDHDPAVTSTDACSGCLIVRNTSGSVQWYIKTSDGDDTDVEQINKHGNLSATTVPGVNDDSSDGYCCGSEWLNTSTGKWYKCRSSAAGAAVWDVLN